MMIFEAARDAALLIWSRMVLGEELDSPGGVVRALWGEKSARRYFQNKYI